MAERDKHAPPDKIVTPRGRQTEQTSTRQHQPGYGGDEGHPSQMQADNRRLRQAQLDTDRERGIRRGQHEQRSDHQPEHRSRGPEDETRNQPRRRSKV